MNSFALLYLFYSAKLGTQATIYFIWLVDSSSRTIAFIAAAVAIFAMFPFFHVIVHIFSSKPLSNPTFIAYLCFSFLLAVLWYEPTRDGKQRILPFAIVTTSDLLALLIFVFQRHISHWHDALTSDIEGGRLRPGGIDAAPATLVGPGIEEVEGHDIGSRPDTSSSDIRRVEVMQGLGYDMNAINYPGRDVDGSVGVNVMRPNSRNLNGWPVRQTLGRERGRRMDSEASRSGAEMAMQRSESAGWATGMLPSVSEHQAADLERDQSQNGFFIGLGMDAGTASEVGSIHSSRPVGIPTVSRSDMHPTYRDTVDSTSQYFVTAALQE